MTERDDPTARRAMAALAAYQLLLGLSMVLSPGRFHDAVANFGARNDHHVRDVASWELALAALALAAVRRPAWRLPVVALALVHFALHALNHLVDVGDAEPAWVGPFDLAALALGTAALAWLLRRVARGAAA